MPETLYTLFCQQRDRYPENAFLAVPPAPKRGYAPDGLEWSYAEVGARVERMAERYREAGFGHGHRVALLLENRPEHVVHKLALNALGVSAVPVNPDYRPGEIAYLLDHSEAALAISVPERLDQMRAGIAEAGNGPALVALEDTEGALPAAPTRPPAADAPSASTESCLLYTSGTTGRPKGCILSNDYEVSVGAWYASRGGCLELHPGAERLFNPLPLFHVNAAITGIGGMLTTGGCVILPDRFHPSTWWEDVCATRASIVHYLGVVAPMLLNQPENPHERAHGVRFGLGAGVEPQLHAPFEERFGFPLVEVWGMTEIVRVLCDNEEPRQVGTRAFGKPVPGLEAKVVGEADAEVPCGTEGELVVRHSAETPRKGFFSGYLKDPEATEDAWRGGWFHTGDTVRQGADGMLYFVDRKKNIIRRAGENIAAAEIEAALQSHAAVEQVAVLAAPDEVREEEVFACVVPMAGHPPDRALAEALFEHAFRDLAYFKAPGWLLFVEDLPKTGSQKIQKHQIFPKGTDPRTAAGVYDFRPLKKRNR